VSLAVAGGSVKYQLANEAADHYPHRTPAPNVGLSGGYAERRFSRPTDTRARSSRMPIALRELSDRRPNRRGRVSPVRVKAMSVATVVRFRSRLLRPGRSQMSPGGVVGELGESRHYIADEMLEGCLFCVHFLHDPTKGET
jgi:hypothetical protein